MVSMAQPASPVIIRVRNPGPEVEGVDLRAPYGARGFRIRGHWVHLTFAGLYPGELTKGQVARLLAAKCRRGCEEYVVGREKHERPTDPERDEHFHVFLASVEAWDSTNQNLFDLRGRNGRRLHPYIQMVNKTAGDRKRIIRYDIKDGDVDMKLAEPLDSQMEQDNQKWSDTVKAAVETGKTPKEVMDEVWNKHTDKFLMYGDRVEKAVKRKHEEMNAESPANYKISEFNREPLVLGDLKCVVLSGPAGTGKTEFALAHFKCPVLVRTRDDLKDIKKDTDGVVLDDMNFTEWSVEDTIHLLDMAQASSISCRYERAKIPKRTPRIFTTNLECEWPHEHIFRAGATPKQHGGITRRFRVEKITGPLFDS